MAEAAAEVRFGGLIGRKVGMTQLFVEGRTIPVTVLEAGPCRVVEVRSPERHGYSAAQLSFEERDERRLTRAVAGHFKKNGVPTARYLREVPVEGPAQPGETITAAIFAKDERVDVSGISRGKGFAGVIKRHHFSGGPATHGSMFHRQPGSIGASSFPSRVWKNKKLPGRMGGERVTEQSLRVVEVRPEEHLLFVEGAVPGSPGTLVMICRSVKARKKG